MSIDIPVSNTTLLYGISVMCGIILVVINISWAVRWFISLFCGKSKQFQNILHNFKINWRFYLSMVLLSAGWSSLVLSRGDPWGMLILLFPLGAMTFAISMASGDKNFPH